MNLTCKLHVTSGGNLFMQDVAALYAAALRDVGVHASVVVEDVPVGGDGVVDVIVAPHEWFTVGPRLTSEDAFTVAATSVTLGTEQPDSPWFDLALPHHRNARATLDLNRRSVEALEAAGVAATYAPVGYHPSLDAWGGSHDRERPVDVAFLGSATPRRAAALGAMADVLWHRPTRLLLHDPRVPVTEDSPWFVTGRRRSELLASSRVLLNVHRHDEPYFEWVRAIEAFANGAVLVSEPSTDHEPCQPFHHMVTAELDDLGADVTALLNDEPLRRELATAAYELVRGELDLRRLVADLVPVLESAASSGRPRRRPPVLRRATDTRRDAPSVAPTDGERLLAAAKRVIISQLALTRRLDDLTTRQEGRDPEAVEERATPAWEGAEPEVAVVVPLYRYGHLVRGALDSVVASADVAVEIVVVEDHSGDGTRQVLEAYIDEHPEVPMLGLFRNANRGLGAARNLGIARSRAECCFLLDADNDLRPTALRRLLDAITKSEADLAYSMIEVYGDERSLLSHLPFSAESLVRGNYLDAMSLMRRSAWERVGGFLESTDESVYGWEDYAFWLGAASAGLRAEFVPEPLCRYRRHAASMISVTNLDPVGPHRYLRDRYPELPWP